MDLQESVIRQVHTLVGWPASPRYSDIRGRLTEKLLTVVDADEEWGWDGPMTAVWSEGETIHLAVTPSELVVAIEDPEVDPIALCRDVISVVREELRIAKFEFLGSSSIRLAPAPSIGELNAWLAERMGSLGRYANYDPFGGKPKSLGIQVEFGDDDFSYDVDLRAMTASEAAEGDDFFSEREDDFPPAALLLEVRRSRLAEIEASKALDLWEESLTKNLEAGERFDAILREEP